MVGRGSGRGQRAGLSGAGADGPERGRSSIGCSCLTGG